LILVMLNNDWFDFTFVNEKDIFLAIVTTLSGIVGGFIILFFGGVKLMDTRLFKKIALVAVQDSKEGYTSSFIKKDMIGKTGTAYTVLRPSGKVILDGDLFDAFTRGNYVKKDEKIIVIADEGTTLKVKLFTEETNNEDNN